MTTLARAVEIVINKPRHGSGINGGYRCLLMRKLEFIFSAIYIYIYLCKLGVGYVSL